jgi:hypothetical protein
MHHFSLNPEGKISLARSRHSWEDNIEMSLKEMGSLGVDWFELALNTVQWQLALMKTAMYVRAAETIVNVCTS